MANNRIGLVFFTKFLYDRLKQPYRTSFMNSYSDYTINLGIVAPEKEAVVDISCLSAPQIGDAQ